ncbi:hypothetical protein Tco_1017837 [Tanacetum coccineum]|uniref:Uncharacterized protein n=1 Tax=Tanacetum coccineum TaxID=301880 RepID=A0ABQ5FUL3_9ASTR
MKKSIALRFHHLSQRSVVFYDNKNFFKDFENEFLAIVYNDALTSKSDFLTEPTLCPQHIDEFDLKDETSLSEYDEVEQNILYFNDLFPFNIIYPDDLKSGKDNDDNKIDIIQSSGDMAPLPPRDQRHLWLCYQVEGYTEEIVHDFEQRLKMIFGRQVNRVHILDFEGLTPDMRQDLAERLRMVYTRDDGQEIFVSHAWRRLFEIRAPLVQEFILEFFSTCRISNGLLRSAPSYTYIRDPVQRLCHRDAEGRKSGARLSGGHFIGRLAHHFGLVSDDGLRGLSVVTRELPLIDMGELVKLNICMEVGDDWAWVAQGAERQPVAAAAALGGAEDAPDIDEGAQAVPAPIHAPPPPPPAAGIRWDLSRELPRGLREAYQTQDRRTSLACEESWKNDGYCNGGNLPGAYIIKNTLRYQDLEWYEALKDGKLKEKALKNKAIMDGMIEEDDESSNEGWKRWDDFDNTNHDNEESENEMEHEEEERCEVFDDHERPVCYIRRFEIIKYSFRDDEEYVAIKENEYDDLTNTSKEAIHAYQEIFRMMDEGWMVTRTE